MKYVHLAVLGLMLGAPSPARANGRFPESNQLVFSAQEPDLVLLRVTFGLLVSHDRAGSNELKSTHELLAQMLGVTLALMITEGSGGALPLAAGILGGQILIGIIVLALVSIGVLRLLDRTLGERAAIASYLLVVAIFVAALALPIYRTPFRASGIHSTLAEVFE